MRIRWVLSVLAFCLLPMLATTAQEKSVKPGINKSFENPDVKDFLKKFEGESREIAVNAKEIVAVCKIKPGMAVADVGAGTGLFTRKFTVEVGEKGKVYAVDISSTFLKHIEKTCEEDGIKNVETVLCDQFSTKLPKNSVDLVFICDTYHHFEFPQRTLQSIHEALRPGGQVVLIDFHRIEGKSREFITGHVRAGQDVFVAEVKAAGFKVVGEEKANLKENYFVRFEKVKKDKPATAEYQAVTCVGEYKHHLQGVCTDGRDSIFWCFTTKLVKTDRSGKLVKQVDVTNHHGDLCFHQGRVYVALNLGKFNDPKGNADSWVYVYDAGDLSCVAKHKTPEVFHGAGGIAFHDGRFLVVGGLPNDVNENYVYEYDIDFKFVKKHFLASGHTHLGIQTAAFADGYWLFGCYGRPKSDTAPSTPPILLKAEASLKKVEKFEFDCSLGIVPVGEGRFLVARGGTTKGKGHIGRLTLAVPDKERGLKLVEK